MEVVQTEIPDVLLIKPKVFGDARGFFIETYSEARYAAQNIPAQSIPAQDIPAGGSSSAGASARFVQDNLSRSRRGVLRGLHIQHPFAQGKLVSVVAGAVFDVAVDVRAGSPYFGRWVGVELTAENHYQLYVPPGFAHGFCTLTDDTLFSYKCTELYHPETEFGVRYDDADIGISWPIANPQVSEKDSRFPSLKEIPESRLPSYR